MPDERITFEASLEKLEAITEAIESPEITLDASLELYKEGVALAAACAKILSEAEHTVTLLQKEVEGAFALVPFGDDDE
jgi:exodeoxyribonuclease VII small subunit